MRERHPLQCCLISNRCHIFLSSVIGLMSSQSSATGPLHDRDRPVIYMMSSGRWWHCHDRIGHLWIRQDWCPRGGDDYAALYHPYGPLHTRLHRGDHLSMAPPVFEWSISEDCLGRACLSALSVGGHVTGTQPPLTLPSSSAFVLHRSAMPCDTINALSPLNCVMSMRWEPLMVRPSHWAFQASHSSDVSRSVVSTNDDLIETLPHFLSYWFDAFYRSIKLIRDEHSDRWHRRLDKCLN